MAASIQKLAPVVNQTPERPGAQFTNPEAERALLGALATSGRLEDLARLDREDFTVESHRVLYEAIARRLEAGAELSDVLLADDVRASGIPLSTVMQMYDEAGGSVVAYLPILRDCRLRRLCNSLGSCLVQHAADATSEPRDTVRWLRQQLARIEEVARR
jgi:replicative DNA helicase